MTAVISFPYVKIHWKFIGSHYFLNFYELCLNLVDER